MRSCLALLLFVVVLSVTACRCGAQDAIGYSEDAAIIPALRQDCEDSLYVNHDWSFTDGLRRQ